MSGIFKITPHIKNYSWGSTDGNSWVGRISNEIGLKTAPFAEAWYGDHTNGPALHQGKNISLLYPEKLNFLGKILSIARPLSIQVHPSSELAETLHKKFPEEFKDSYAKEEGAIALSKVELAHSFIKDRELNARISEFPEMGLLLKDEQTIQHAVKKILSATKAEIELATNKLWERIENKNSNLLIKNLKTLKKLYPQGDVGIFILLLMNVFELQAGEAIYTPAGCPHAYLSGELIEIMKPSDNVLRCGLTDKKIDVENFLKALKPQQSSATMSSINACFQMGSLKLDIVSSNQKVLTDCNPKIALSLDAKGKLTCENSEESFKALSSFLIIRDKAVDIQIETGRLILFGLSN